MSRRRELYLPELSKGNRDTLAAVLVGRGYRAEVRGDSILTDAPEGTVRGIIVHGASAADWFRFQRDNPGMSTLTAEQFRAQQEAGDWPSGMSYREAKAIHARAWRKGIPPALHYSDLYQYDAEAQVVSEVLARTT
jgi:hypothetical protein